MYSMIMILNIYKENGWTSFDVVKKVRNILANKIGRNVKTGHAGTLDPLAEGVLLVLTDKDTKLQDKFMNMEKEYICEISFGATSPTYDLESELTYHKIPAELNVEKELERILPDFVGELKQTAPAFSAKKVEGRPMYKKARKGGVSQDELPIKKITIFNIEKIDFFSKENLPAVKLRVTCGKGTYIRSLAHDLGERLGTGAVLTKLVRTRIGNYTTEQSLKVSELEEKLEV